MKKLIYILLASSLFACSSRNTEFVHQWNFSRISNVDSSANVETLLNTFLVNHWTKISKVEITDRDIILLDNDGSELGRTSCSTNSKGISFKFSDDAVQTNFEVEEFNNDTLKLTAQDQGETLKLVIYK